MSVRARRRGREEAFKLLFQADQGVSTWDEMMALERQENGAPPAAWAFAEELAGGVWQHLAEVDAWLDKLAHGWSVERMAAADRAILRLAVYEVTHDSDTPLSVAINEAVELAKKYGTDDSPRFINGILGALAREINRDLGELPQQADGAETALTPEADSEPAALTQEADSERMGTGEQS